MASDAPPWDSVTTVWAPILRTRNFKQQFEMLQRRLDYQGGRKARSAERRIQRILGPMHVLFGPGSRWATETRKVSMRLLSGVVATDSGGTAEVGK